MDERDKRIMAPDASEHVLEAMRPHFGETLESLVDKAPELGFKPHNMARNIYEMEAQGRLYIKDPNPPSGFGSYLLSTYSLHYWLLLTLLALQAYVILWMPQVYPLIYLRYLVVGIFIVYVPGYTLIEALYPKANELDRLERIGLRIALSIVIVPLVGLFLNYTPWGIRLEPALVMLSILSASLGMVALYRKYDYWIMGPT